MPNFVSYVFANMGLFFPNKLGLFSKVRAAIHSSFFNSKDLVQRPLQSGSLVEQTSWACISACYLGQITDSMSQFPHLKMKTIAISTSLV